MHNTPTLRVARPTDDLSALLQFYREGLGMTVLYEFKDHDGFDGVMLGWQGAPYHLEFTHAQGHMAGRAPTEDNLLIFYVPDRRDWEAAVLCRQQAFNRPGLSIRIGIGAAGHLRIPTDIEL